MWSSDFQQIFAQAGVMKRMPIINTACPYEQQHQALQNLHHNNPQIVSPLAQRHYYIEHDNPKALYFCQLLLRVKSKIILVCQ